MYPSAPELHLDEFIAEMGRTPPKELTHDRLMEHVHRLRLSDALVEGRALFAGGQYARNLVCRTPFFELLVLCWHPGQQSTIHDHAGALNAIGVRRGVLTSRTFAPASGAPGTGPVVPEGTALVSPGDGWIGVDRGGVHQLANTSDDDLVTVHVYAPPLMELTVYSTESDAVERRPLRYTLSEDLE